MAMNLHEVEVNWSDLFSWCCECLGVRAGSYVQQLLLCFSTLGIVPLVCVVYVS